MYQLAPKKLQDLHVVRDKRLQDVEDLQREFIFANIVIEPRID